MKKFVAIAVCTFLLALGTAAFAQTTTTPGAGAGADGAATTPGTAAPAPTTPPATGAAPASPGMGADGAAPAAPGMGADGAATQAEPTEAISGWSVKDSIMGKPIVNENDEKIGDVNDVVLASDGKAAYFIVGAGGFLGMGERDVAIPYQEITQSGDDKLVLQGYTKDQLKALPRVEVAK